MLYMKAGTRYSIFKGWKEPATVLGKDGQCELVKHGSIYCRVHSCHLMKKKEMGFNYAETREMKSKDASILCRLPDSDSDGKNDDDFADVESEKMMAVI